MVPNMKAKYTADVAPALMKKFEYESVMQIPKIDKVVINVGSARKQTVTPRLSRLSSAT